MFLEIYSRSRHAAIGLCATLLCLMGSVRAQGDFFGYVVIEAVEGRIPAASALFSLRVGGTLISEAGVGAVTPLRQGRVFVDRKGTETGVALVNSSNASVTATLVLRDLAGTEVCRTGREIEALGHLAKFVPELFSEADPPCPALPSIGSLTIETPAEGPGLASVTLRQSTNPNRPVLATLPVAALQEEVSSALRQQQAASALVFPQIGAGPLTSTLTLSTQIILINRTTRSNGGEIKLFDSNGEALELALEVDSGNEPGQGQIIDKALPQGASGSSSTYRYDLQPDGVFRGTLTTSAQVSVGYAVVTPDPGHSLPGGTAVFQYRDGQDSIISEAGVASAAATRAARIFVDTANTSTGVAIALPGEVGARVSLDLLDRNGFSIQKVTLDLGAGEHLARFPAELFRPENLPAGFTGLIEIRSDVDIHIVTLKLTQSDAETQGLPT